MEGTFRAEPGTRFGMITPSEIRFTGPGYCRELTGRPGTMRNLMEGRCELKNGGIELTAALGYVQFYRIEDSNTLVWNGESPPVRLIRQ
jgi:hypothetical protein